MKYIISLLLFIFFVQFLYAQNVGIGTTAPAAPLHVLTGVNVNTILESSNGQGTSLKLKNTSTGGGSWNITSTGVLNNSGAGKLLLNNDQNLSVIAAFQADGTVGIGITHPNASSVLDITSTTKGFLPPRMSSAQRDAIVSPSKGLTIYDTTNNVLESFNGTTWTSSTNSGTAHFIGESYGGGIVFYIYDSGQHGLIAATADQSSNTQWGAFSITNAVRDGINAGQNNTERMFINQGTGSYAAQICAIYQGGGFGDWYLPSRYELNLLHLQKDVVGGFATPVYWSSTEIDDNGAWGQNFSSGFQGNFSKDGLFYVRAVRAF